MWVYGRKNTTNEHRTKRKIKKNFDGNENIVIRRTFVIMQRITGMRSPIFFIFCFDTARSFYKWVITMIGKSGMNRQRPSVSM